MENESNLIPMSRRSKEEVRAIGSKGGKASVKSRRRKKNLKEKMELLLSLPAADNDKAQLAAMGVDDADMDNEMVLATSMLLAALNGDTKAFDRVIDIVGKSVQREELELKKQQMSKPDTVSDEQVSKLYDALGADDGDDI